jgi:ABC-type transporter MlaC component
MSISFSGTLSSSGFSAASAFVKQSSSGSSASSSSGSSAASEPATDPAVQKFLEYAKMTPAERLHAQMLAKLGLTEQQFKALSPADQQKINDKIREMIKKQLAGSSDTRTGMITDKTA